MRRLSLALALIACEASTLGERLFQHGMPLAEQSMQGRFIREMVQGTLPKAAFDYYLHQDNLYLSKYARAFGVMGAKASKTDELAWLLNRSVGFLHEHGRDKNNALSEATFDKEASAVTVAYTSFLLESAWEGDMLLAYASVLPCQRLYDWLFETINRTKQISEENPYRKFILQYADPLVHADSLKMESFLERYATAPKEALERAQAHYDTALRYEAEFFDQAFQAEARLLAQPEALAAQPDVEVRDMTISTPLGVVVMSLAFLLTTASVLLLLRAPKADERIQRLL